MHAAFLFYVFFCSLFTEKRSVYCIFSFVLVGLICLNAFVFFCQSRSVCTHLATNAKTISVSNALAQHSLVHTRTHRNATEKSHVKGIHFFVVVRRCCCYCCCCFSSKFCFCLFSFFFQWINYWWKEFNCGAVKRIKLRLKTDTHRIASIFIRTQKKNLLRFCCFYFTTACVWVCNCWWKKFD